MVEPIKLRDVNALDDDTVLDGTPDPEEFELEEEVDFEDPESDVDGETDEPTMTKALPLKDTLKHTINDIGIVELEKQISEAVERIEALREKREKVNTEIATKKSRVKELNGKVTAELDGLEVKGLNKKGVKMALEYALMTDDERSGFDQTYRYVRAAMKIPIQGDLFLDGKPAE